MKGILLLCLYLHYGRHSTSIRATQVYPRVEYGQGTSMESRTRVVQCTVLSEFPRFWRWKRSSIISVVCSERGCQHAGGTRNFVSHIWISLGKRSRIAVLPTPHGISSFAQQSRPVETAQMEGLDNPNPEVRQLVRKRKKPGNAQTLEEKIFDTIRDIRDPEHPHSLEELSVIDAESIAVKRPNDDSPGYGRVTISFTPTVPHCSLASIIGLSIRSKLDESGVLRPRGDHYYKLTVACAKGSHSTAEEINRQLADKERVSAAFENPRIAALLRECTNNLPG